PDTARTFAQITVQGAARGPRPARRFLRWMHVPGTSKDQYRLHNLRNWQCPEICMRGNLVQLLRDVVVFRQNFDQRPANLLLQGRFSKRPRDLHRHVISMGRKREGIGPHDLMLLQTGEPPRSLDEHVPAELLVYEIVAYRLPQDRVPYSGEQLMPLGCQVQRLHVV